MFAESNWRTFRSNAVTCQGPKAGLDPKNRITLGSAIRLAPVRLLKSRIPVDWTSLISLSLDGMLRLNGITFPEESRVMVVTCVGFQALALWRLANYGSRSAWMLLIAFFVGGFVSDWISGLAHFGFDYIWPAKMPILGPIAVQFREHHEFPTLDPSALLANVTKGAYAALPMAVIASFLCRTLPRLGSSSTLASIVTATSLWSLGFHQIHSYAHMGSHLSPEKFQEAVANVMRLPADKRDREFSKVFDSVRIPRSVRLCQQLRLFIRPEVHWHHHISFDQDFASVNGWSDITMNWLYRRLAARRKALRGESPGN